MNERSTGAESIANRDRGGAWRSGSQIDGAREEVLEAIIDPEQLQRLGFLPMSCFRRSQEITLDRGGRRRHWPWAVCHQDSQRRDTAEDVFGSLIASEGVVSVRDVVTLRRTFKDPTGFTRTNGAGHGD